VKDLQVTDPTTSSLKVRWEPAEGNVRHYRLFYTPVGGAEDMVRQGRQGGETGPPGGETGPGPTSMYCTM